MHCLGIILLLVLLLFVNTPGVPVSGDRGYSGHEILGYRRPCSDFMDMLRRIISCHIIIIIIQPKLFRYWNRVMPECSVLYWLTEN